MIAHIYARVSTGAQVTKYSLPTQLEACHSKATELGVSQIIEHVDDGYSGDDFDRPAMTALREALKDGNVDYVICYDPDRFSRSLVQQLIITDEIEKAGAELIFVLVNFEKTPEGQLFYQMRGAISAYEKAKIKERTVRGKRGKAKSGKIVFNTRPTGYDYDKDKSMYYPNKDAELVRNLFNMAISGMATSAIARTLNHNGTPAPKGGKWHAETIRRIIHNPMYYGQAVQFRQKATLVKRKKIVSIRDKDDWITVSCPAIVSKEEHDVALYALQQQQKFAPRNEKIVALLRGLLYCNKCGSKMMIVTCGRNGDKKYYKCSSSKKNRDFAMNIACDNTGVKVDFLDNQLWLMLQDLINHPDKIKELMTNENTDSYVKTYDNLSKRHTALVGERDTCMKWFRQKLIPESEAEKQLNDIKRQLDSIDKQMNELKIYKTKSSDIDDKVQTFINIVSNSDNKRDACMKVLDKVYYERFDQQKGKISNPDVSLKLFLR